MSRTLRLRRTVAANGLRPRGDSCRRLYRLCDATRPQPESVVRRYRLDPPSRRRGRARSWNAHSHGSRRMGEKRLVRVLSREV